MSWFRRLTGRGVPTPAGPDVPSIYAVELLFESPPRPDPGAILAAIRAHRPAAEAAHDSDATKALLFVHPDRPVRLKDTTIPAQVAVLATGRPFEVTPALAADLDQSWHFPAAREVVARCRHAMMVTDMMASLLDRHSRLELFQDTLAGILAAVPPAAIHWRPTGQFVDPAGFLAAHREGGFSRFFHGALNVRNYRISNSLGDRVMDTLGLAPFGLPDLQCHFRGLDTQDVAAVLGNTAYYLFEHGDVIADGHTVEGITPGSRWRCQHEDALVGPGRVVLDLDPGPPHAAGNRAKG